MHVHTYILYVCMSACMYACGEWPPSSPSGLKLLSEGLKLLEKCRQSSAVSSLGDKMLK